MTTPLREPFLLWQASRDSLNGGREGLDLRLRKSKGFSPFFSSRHPVWLGGIVAGVCVLFLIGVLGNPPQTLEEKAAIPYAVALLVGVGVLGAFNAIQSWRGLRLRARALGMGQFIEGKIISSSGRLSTYSGSREGGTGEPTDFYNVTIEYEFTTPTGQRLWATATNVRNDLENGLNLPQSGDSVQIFYVDERRFLLL